MSARGPEWWLAKADAAEEAELAAARAEGRLAVVDISEALRGCPPETLARVMEARRARSPEARERRLRRAHELRSQARAAESLARSLESLCACGHSVSRHDEGGGACLRSECPCPAYAADPNGPARAAAQRSRAAALLAEADLTSQV